MFAKDTTQSAFYLSQMNTIVEGCPKYTNNAISNENNRKETPEIFGLTL